MRGRLAILAVLLLFCSPLLQTAPAGAYEAPSPPEWDPREHIVDAAGGGNFTTIQAAIDAAGDMDSIYVRAGTYRENLVIDKYLQIIGEGPSNTTIVGDGTTDVVRMAWVSPGVFGGFTVTNGTTHSGVNLMGTASTTVVWCNIYGNRYGIRADGGCLFLDILGNEVHNNTDAGIWFQGNQSRIQSNRCHHNGVGMSVTGTELFIWNNTCYLNGRGISVGTSPRNVLLMGNSYTQANGLDGLLEKLMGETVPDVDATSLTSGGLTLADHADRASTPGTGWNRTLNGGSPWDVVVLQDQSQVPGFPTDNAYWQASLAGLGSLHRMANVTGADTVLLMTWGRRDGDPTNPGIYPNFTAMQERLDAGSRMYAENVSTPGKYYGRFHFPGRPVHIAPAGLAFRVVHDRVLEAGGDPTSPGNAFYDLYSSDGSHPSLSGSYLTACVLYATLTGNSPLYLEDDVALQEGVKRMLRGAAATVVFDETPDHDYPWRPASDLRIEENTLDRNDVGMMVGCLASDSEVRGCRFTENLGPGVHVLDWGSWNNTFHGNGFRGNGQGGIQAVDDGRGNAWDSGGRGNYWSDYEARFPNATSDGVTWDTPYVLASGSRDRWPLVRFRPFEDQTPPVARAGTDVEVGQGVTVRFDGTASTDDRGVVNHTWTFEYDGQQVVLHGGEAEFTFHEVGVYEVTLTVRDEAGNAAEDVLTVTVRDTTPPVADAGDDIVTDQGQVVTLDGTGSTDNVGVVGYLWEVLDTDGMTPYTGPRSWRLFSDAGVFTATLTVTDAEGNSASDTVTVTVRDITQPHAHAGTDRTVDQGDTVTFDGGGSRDNVGVVGYRWTIEDAGGTHEEEGRVVEHAFASAGVFTATLTVRDLAGNEATTSVQVTVRDTEDPVATAGGDRTVDEDHPLVLDGTASTDNVGITEWTWAIDGGDATVTLDGPTVEWTFEEPGVHRVQLTVRDAGGNYAITVIAVTVLDITAPEAAQLPGLSVRQGEAVTLDGTASTDNVAVASYRWSYEEDGTTVTLEGPRVEHTFALAGEFTLHLTVLDDAGNEGSSSFLVVVRDSESPVVPPIPDVETWTGRRVTMASAATDNVGVTVYTWTFRDGGRKVVLRGQRISHAFEDPGDHRVTLTVEDAEGNQATQEFTVTVQRPLWTWAALAGVALVAGAVVGSLVRTRSRTGRNVGRDGSRP